MKNYGEDVVRFEDLEQLWNGPGHDLDLIECGGRLAATIACVGLDARVADDVHRFSKVLPVSGKWPIWLQRGQILQEHRPADDDHLRCASYHRGICDGVFCNGRYYGGGFMPVADARMDDGRLDTLIVRRVSRAKFLRLAPAYARVRRGASRMQCGGCRPTPCVSRAGSRWR